MGKECRFLVALRKISESGASNLRNCSSDQLLYLRGYASFAIVDVLATVYLIVGEAILDPMTAAIVRAVFEDMACCVVPLPSMSISRPRYRTDPVGKMVTDVGVHCGV